MKTTLPWGWIALAAFLLLLPGAAARLLLDLLGGVTLLLVLLPLLAGGAALIGWQVLRSRLRTCSACGFSSLGTSVCPACGSPFEGGQDASGQDVPLDASTATITVEATPVSDGSRSDNPGTH